MVMVMSYLDYCNSLLHGALLMTLNRQVCYQYQSVLYH